MTKIGYRVLGTDGVSCNEYFGPGHRTLEEILARRPGATLEEVEVTTYGELLAGSLFYPKSMSAVLHQVSSPWEPLAQMLGTGELAWSVSGGLGVIGLVDGVAWATRLVEASASAQCYKWTGREYS